jgi:hypothetical protein
VPPLAAPPVALPPLSSVPPSPPPEPPASVTEPPLPLAVSWLPEPQAALTVASANPMISARRTRSS